MDKLKLLITSVGSLVGQNILDVLDSPLCNRRKITKVIGTNSIAANPQNFRCDSSYHVAKTSSANFKNELISIIDKEQPDLILNGRDEDTEVVSIIIAENPHIQSKFPYGNLSTIQTALYKDKTYEFCMRHSLPFAETLTISKCNDTDLHNFLAQYPFPLIAKPIQGFASKGVYYLRNWADINYVKELNGYIVQEYLGKPDRLEEYFHISDGPVPLFAHAPDVYQISCHTIINSDKTFSPFFISRNEHDSGVTVEFKKMNFPELETIAVNYAKAFIEENGFGPLTIQFRQNRDGIWKAHEINLRTNGNTYPRFLMGQDDIGLIVRGLFPKIEYPVYESSQLNKNTIIGKSLKSYVMNKDWIDNLSENKNWP